MVINDAIDNDPPEGNAYDLVEHVKTSTVLRNTSNRLDILEARAYTRPDRSGK